MPESGDVASPGDPGVDAAELRTLGGAALEAGDASAAARLLARAVELDPGTLSLRLELANALLFAGRAEEALAHYDWVLARQPGRAEAQVARADLLLDLGRPAEAAAGYRRALALRPGFRHAAHMLELLGGEAAEARDHEYVAALFDDYATKFDDHLGELGYRVPAAMKEALLRHVGARVPLTTLDLGCGTGLIATALEGIAAPIDGIDLSAQMVEVARRKGLYRTLAVGDVGDLVGSSGFAGPYDLVTAGDVLSYLRDLQAVFAAVGRVLAPGGLFAFTIEDTDVGEAVLRSSGRFAHGAAYIRRVAATQGLEVVDDTELTLRTERLQPVAGRLFVFEARR